MEIKDRREQYYTGYLAALQDITRDFHEGGWDHLAEILDKLTRAAVRDIIRETQIEDKLTH